MVINLNFSSRQSHRDYSKVSGLSFKDVQHLDRLLFWNERDLQNKLDQYQKYYNEERAHSALKSQVPNKPGEHLENNVIPMHKYEWQSHCSDLFQLPIAA